VYDFIQFCGAICRFFHAGDVHYTIILSHSAKTTTTCLAQRCAGVYRPWPVIFNSNQQKKNVLASGGVEILVENNKRRATNQPTTVSRDKWQPTACISSIINGNPLYFFFFLKKIEEKKTIDDQR
jgi:hypothetical protein